MLIEQRSAVEKSYKRYHSNLTREIGLYGTPMGVHELNMITGGHVPSKVTTLAARSGQGKTGLVTQMSEVAGKVIEGKRSELLVYSWEMEASFLADRYVCWKVGITLPELRYSRILPQAIRSEINKAYAEAAKFPIAYHQYSTNIETIIKTNLEWLSGVAKKEKMEGIKIQPVMVLDYVGMVQGNAKYGNKTYDLANFLQTLKQHANETGLSCFLLAQINRTADTKEYPDVTDLSDSQSIEQNSDTLIILDRPEYRRKELLKHPDTGMEVPAMNKAMLRVVKNREGQVKDYLINCDISRFRFWSENMAFGDDYMSLYKEEQFWRNHFNV